MKSDSAAPPAWILSAGKSPASQLPTPLKPWIQAIAEAPRSNIGELEDCTLIEGAFPEGWMCAFLPEYILQHTFVAAAQSIEGRYVMLFFSAVGEELHYQERPPTPNLIGWYHVRLIKQVMSKDDLLANLRHAFKLLNSHGFL